MNVNQPEENVVSGLYENYSETQKEILAIETRKTRNKLITIACIIFLFDLIALAFADAVNLLTFLWILIVPVVFLGLAFFAIKEPLAAIIIVSVIIVGIWIYSIIITGGAAAISGWLGKAIIIYLLIAGFQSAKEATRLRKELQSAV